MTDRSHSWASTSSRSYSIIKNSHLPRIQSSPPHHHHHLQKAIACSLPSTCPTGISIHVGATAVTHGLFTANPTQQQQPTGSKVSKQHTAGLTHTTIVSFQGWNRRDAAAAVDYRKWLGEPEGQVVGDPEPRHWETGIAPENAGSRRWGTKESQCCYISV